MKKILLISIMILLAFSLKATQYYVNASTGSNGYNGLTAGTAWATVSYACGQVAAGSHTINVAAGTYNEGNNVMNLAVGVSLVGAGAITTTINSTYSYATGPGVLDKGSIRLSSGTPNTNGNQTVSNITLTGTNRAATKAIVIRNRGNVKILNCIIKNFFVGGIALEHTNMYSTSSSLVFCENNEIAFCTIDDCGDVDATYNGDGLIFMTCQKDLLIHDNLLYNNKRVGDHNGNIINAGGARFRGVKFYNNSCYKPDPPYSGLNFHLEIWGNDGGFEIYDNTFYGGVNPIDVGGHGENNNTGGYAYVWSIHNNLFRMNSTNDYTTTTGFSILLEAYYLGKCLIYNNTFNNLYEGIRLTSWNIQDIYIYDNTFNKVKIPFTSVFDVQGGTPVGGLSVTNINIYRNKIYCNMYTNQGINALISFAVSSGWELTNVNIYNNTLVTNNLGVSGGIKFTTSSGNTATNVNIKNNILTHFKNVGPLIVVNNGTFNGLHIENNFCYNTSSYNALPSISGNSVTNYTYSNHLPVSSASQTSPLFVNESTQDYHLQASSPCVNTGQTVQIDGVDLLKIGVASDRGYIEYDDGTIPEETISLGTVTIGTSIFDANSYYITANVTDGGSNGGIISERGIVWNTSTNPTTANNKLQRGGGTGAYNAYFEPLASNTTYYLRAYCINQTGTAYSANVSGTTTLVTPAVTATSTITGVEFVSSRAVIISVNTLTDGGAAITERGVCYGTSANPTTSGSKLLSGSGNGAFFNLLSSLSPATVYYFRAYTINSAGTSYSPQVSVGTTVMKKISSGTGQTVMDKGRKIKY